MFALRTARRLVQSRASSWTRTGHSLYSTFSNHLSRGRHLPTHLHTVSPVPIPAGALVPRRSLWFRSSSAEQRRQTAGEDSKKSSAEAQSQADEKPDETLLPPGAEGVPFRLAPEDALEAYARWSWQESPWFKPIQPERLRPIYAPFWVFEFTLTVTDKETGAVTKVPYRNLYGNSNMQYFRRKAAQIYAGTRFNRLLVDVLKAPVTLARRWNGQEMLKIPTERAYGVFSHYVEEDEDDVDQDSIDEGRRPKRTATAKVKSADEGKYMSFFPNPDFTIKNPPPPRPIELDAFALSETIAWGRVQEAVVSTELAILHHYYVHGAPIDNAYGSVSQPGKKLEPRKGLLGVFDFFTGKTDKNAQVVDDEDKSGEYQQQHQQRQQQAGATAAQNGKSEANTGTDLNLDLDDLRAAFMFRAHGTLDSLSAPPSEATAAAESLKKRSPIFSRTSAKSVQQIKDRYTFSFEDIQSRRVYLPGYVTEYKSLMKYWRVFTSGVTGETFGLQQLGPLGFASFTKRLKFHPWMMVLVNDLNLKIGGIILRKLLMTPAAAAISAVIGGAVMVARRFKAHRMESEIERKWNQIREDEAKMDAFLESGRDLWMFRRPASESDKRQAENAKRLWDFVTREDVAHRERLRRQADKKRRQEMEKQRLENLAKPPPKIPEDPYELLGLAAPKTRAEANAYTQHDISQAFRRQIMLYHPDTYNEETAHWSKAYSHKRTQAIIEAYGLIKSPALRSAYNARYPDR